MEHDLELLIPRLEILEIEVFNILQNPGNIGKRIFLIQFYPGDIGKRIFSNFSYPGTIGNLTFPIFYYPGNIGSYDPYISPILEIVDRTIHISVLSWKYWIVRSILSPILEIVHRTIHVSVLSWK